MPPNVGTLTPNAVAAMIAANEGLIYQTAQRLHKAAPWIDFEDVASEVRMGWVKAAGAFDPGRGFKFCTFAGIAGYHSGLRYVRREAASGLRGPCNGPLLRVGMVSIAEYEWSEWLTDDCAGPNRVDDAEAAESLWSVVSQSLHGRQAEVLIRHLRDGVSLAELGRQMGVSKMRASQLYRAALDRLRSLCRSDPAMRRAMKSQLECV